MNETIIKQALMPIRPGFSWVYCEWSDGLITRFSVQTTSRGSVAGPDENVTSVPGHLDWKYTDPRDKDKSL